MEPIADSMTSEPETSDLTHWIARAAFRLEDREPYLCLHFVSVYVRDQERSLRFYLEQLGFCLMADARFESGNRWVEVAPPYGTANLALILARPGTEEYALIGRPCLVTFLTEDVEATYREWSARGVPFLHPPQTPAWGGIFARFQDLDGNEFALAGFDDATREIEVRRRSFSQRLEAERRAAQELEIAKEVQSRLFPQRIPSITTLEYAGTCLQARTVGGDYYDFLDLSGGQLALVVADISGKGIGGALLMANLQANLRSQCGIAADQPERFLCSVNRLLYENTNASAYATLFFAQYNEYTRRLRYANCGHLPGLLLHAGGQLERLDSTSTVVGLFPDWQCAFAERSLAQGDTLLLYTDGVTEAVNSGEEEFGEERLIEALRRHRAKPARDLIDALLDDVRRFSAQEQFDDITLIIAKGVNPAQ